MKSAKGGFRGEKGDDTKKKTVPAVRLDAQAEAVIKQLKTEATVLSACKRTGMSRTKFYKLRRENADFRIRADEALMEGISGRCDAAEEALFDLIKDGSMQAIKMYLPTYRAAFSRKAADIEAGGTVEEGLTDEEKLIIDRALKDILPKADELTEKHE